MACRGINYQVFHRQHRGILELMFDLEFIRSPLTIEIPLSKLRTGHQAVLPPIFAQFTLPWLAAIGLFAPEGPGLGPLRPLGA